jgi:hypothetical protein
MNASLEQQNFPNPSLPGVVFASDPTSTVEQPQSPYYADGVEVRFTAPAKWWNWLWNKISKWLLDSKADKTAMETEILNVLHEANITPSGSDPHQLSSAVDIVAFNTCSAYDNAEEDGHKVNQPYVIGHTLYIPDTELL